MIPLYPPARCTHSLHEWVALKEQKNGQVMNNQYMEQNKSTARGLRTDISFRNWKHNDSDPVKQSSVFGTKSVVQ